MIDIRDISYTQGSPLSPVIDGVLLKTAPTVDVPKGTLVSRVKTGTDSSDFINYNPAGMAGEFWRHKLLDEEGRVDILDVPPLYLPDAGDIKYLPFDDPLIPTLPDLDIPNILPNFFEDIKKYLLIGGVAIGGIWLLGKVLGGRK